METPTISVEELREKLDRGEKFYLLDVRTRGEFEAGRLAFSNALIPFDILDKNLDFLPQDKQTPIFCFCRSGRRSGITTEILRNLGYVECYNVAGGIIAWKNAGNEIISGPPPDSIPVL